VQKAFRYAKAHHNPSSSYGGELLDVFSKAELQHMNPANKTPER